MKQNLPLKFALAGLMALAIGESQAQRYATEIFTDEQITVTSNVVYGTNVRFLPPVNFTSTQAQADLLDLQTIAATTGDFPDAYFNLADESTTVKIQNMQLDVYAPDMSVDDVEERPVIIYLHTGNFLPPPTNGSPTGLRTDSTAIVTCRQFAKRGFVAVSVSYRLGWNPLGNSVERRGTLLNAVYRAIQDTKQSVRFLRGDAAGENTFGIDADKFVLFGEGSGGYVALAYATVDDLENELSVPKFINPVTGESYVDPSIVGDEEGLNGGLTIYQDNGQPTDIQMTVNLGGALGEISWLEAGDAPMVAFHAIRDDFAPFDDGTVIVPTTQENVVDVSGSNSFIQAANDLGNNAIFNLIPDGDPFTDAARSFYGTGPYEISNALEVSVNDTPEGLYPILLPLRPFLQNIASPWQWWDPNSPIAATVIAEVGGQPITAHMASLGSNPDMSPEQGRTYLDTIFGYSVPRIMCALELPENPCALSANNSIFENATSVFPNPTRDALTIRNSEFIMRRLEVYDITGRMVSSKVINANEFRFERGQLGDGVYLMQIVFDNNERITKKVLFN